MDDQPELVDSTTHNPESVANDSGMFSRSRHFTVTGQNLTNITNHNYTPPPTLRSDFRMIPMGDIDLRHEIRVDECTGIVNFRRERYCARRLYSARARITGSESNITVVIYQGKGAEQAWQQDIADYMSMRHPNIIQICGAASSNGIHAMLSNDDLIPFKQYMDRYRHSHCLIIFFYACCNTDFTAVHNYIHAAFNRLLHSLECTSWIRCSTGRLCAELAASGESVWLHRWRKIPELPIIHASIPPHARFISMAIESLTIEQYQHICEMNLAQHRYFSISAPVPAAKLGSVFGCSSNYLLEDSVEIASLLKLEVHLGHWSIADGVGEVMNGDWTRFRSSDVCNTSISLIPSVSVDLSPWLSQANHIFRRLRIVSNFEHYVYHRSVTFELNILKATKKPPVGFLFLCPEHNLQTGRLTFCWPDQERAAYWSLDPTGVDRLSTEEATQLGFPPLQFTAMVTGDFWDANVYDALRRFHQAKGFDPDSQDLARHLGEPLYGVSSVIDVASARADEEGYGVDSNSGTAYASDDQSESEHSPTSAVVVDGEVPEPEEDYLDNVRKDRAKSECVEISRSCRLAHHSVSRGTVEHDPFQKEMVVPSGTFKLLINIQLVLILFLGFSWLYDYIWQQGRLLVFLPQCSKS